MFLVKTSKPSKRGKGKQARVYCTCTPAFLCAFLQVRKCMEENTSHASHCSKSGILIGTVDCTCRSTETNSENLSVTICQRCVWGRARHTASPRCRRQRFRHCDILQVNNYLPFTSSADATYSRIQRTRIPRFTALRDREFSSSRTQRHSPLSDESVKALRQLIKTLTLSMVNTSFIPRNGKVEWYNMSECPAPFDKNRYPILDRR
jgi:hypothetical protein